MVNCERVDEPFRVVEKIRENAYKLELSDDYEVSPTFNVKNLRSYHGEDLRTSFFCQFWGIDVRAIPRVEELMGKCW